MLENSFGLLFFLKQSKNSKPGKKYVYLRITVDDLPKELSTKMRWADNRWDQDTGYRKQRRRKVFKRIPGQYFHQGY
jgi:hypothetical protein